MTIAITSVPNHQHLMSQHVVFVIEQVLAKAPQWIRQDFLSTNMPTRRRAEETLAAMIADAVAQPISHIGDGAGGRAQS